jgi:hypothetical protein
MVNLDASCCLVLKYQPPLHLLQNLECATSSRLYPVSPLIHINCLSCKGSEVKSAALRRESPSGLLLHVKIELDISKPLRGLRDGFFDETIRIVVRCGQRCVGGNKEDLSSVIWFLGGGFLGKL